MTNKRPEYDAAASRSGRSRFIERHLDGLVEQVAVPARTVIAAAAAVSAGSSLSLSSVVVGLRLGVAGFVVAGSVTGGD